MAPSQRSQFLSEMINAKAKQSLLHPNPAVQSPSPMTLSRIAGKKPRSNAGSNAPSREPTPATDRMDTSDAPKETSTGEAPSSSVIPIDASIPQPTPLPGQPVAPPPGGDVFTGPQVPPPTYPPREIAPIPSRRSLRANSKAGSPPRRLSPPPKTSAAEAVTSPVNAEAVQGEETTAPQVTFEETPKASRVYAGPINTPLPDPLAFFGQPTKKPKKSESNADSDIEFMDDAQAKADEAKKALDQLMEDMLRELGPEYIRKDEGLGNVRLLDNRKYEGHHCTPPRITLRQFQGQQDGKELLAKVQEDGHSWAYMYMRHHATPTPEDATLFQKGLEALEKTKVFPIRAADYTAHALPRSSKPCNVLLVACRNADAEEQLHRLGRFSFDLKEDHATFFIHHRHTWGNMICVDITNAMPNINDVLAIAMHHFKSYIRWDYWSETEAHPHYLALTRLDSADPTGRMLPSNWSISHPDDPVSWRLVFAPRNDRVMSLQIPEVAGQWAKGTINMALPQFCQSCASYSHSPTNCAWWAVPGVLARVK
ncbi:hypothetical protein FRB99_002387 [Tulasnella sp. 403]|nr:hypothetical protein FRB99_002387 [Tulasnella sp. 403]